MEELKYRIESKNESLAVYETYCTYSTKLPGNKKDTVLNFDKSFADVSEIKQKGRKITVLQSKTKQKFVLKADKADIHNAQFLCDYSNEMILEVRKKQREAWDEISKKAYSKENSQMLFCVDGENYRIDFYTNYLTVENNSFSKDYFYVDMDFFGYIGESEISNLAHCFSIKSYTEKTQVLVKILQREWAFRTFRPFS